MSRDNGQNRGFSVQVSGSEVFLKPELHAPKPDTRNLKDEKELTEMPVEVIDASGKLLQLKVQARRAEEFDGRGTKRARGWQHKTLGLRPIAKPLVFR